MYFYCTCEPVHQSVNLQPDPGILIELRYGCQNPHLPTHFIIKPPPNIYHKKHISNIYDIRTESEIIPGKTISHGGAVRTL